MRRPASGLKLLQWLLRGVQFCCAAIVLAIYSYFLATLSNHGLPTENWVRAVEGISGIAVIYTGVHMLVLWFVSGGHPATSFLKMVLDVVFIGGFIYVASSNRGGAGSCTGSVNTPFGSGDAATNVVDDGRGGFTALPSLRVACQLEAACLAVSILAIFFLIFSILTEWGLGRQRAKARRFDMGPSSGGETTGSPKTSPPKTKRTGLGFFSSFRRGRRGTAHSDNYLPAHTHPDEVRESYATEQTRVGTGYHHPNPKEEPINAAYLGGGSHHSDPVTATGPYETRADASPYGNNSHGAYGHDRLHPSSQTQGLHRADTLETAHFPAGNYRYDDGVYDSRV